MRRAILVLGLAAPATAQEPAPLVPLALDGARDETGAGRAFLELAAPRAEFFVHEPIALVLRLGFERRFLEHGMIQPFQRPLDVPAQVQAAWLAELPGAVQLPPPAEEGGERLAVALDGGVARALRVADRTADGRTFTVLEIERRILPVRAGELRLERPILRFAHATRFEEDFVRGSVASDRVDALVRGNGLALAIRALPEEGRPPEFTGAVGRFTVEAQVEPRALAAGESLRLVLRIWGEGDLERFGAPRLALDGFEIRGSVDEAGPELRAITYDLAPLGTWVREVPPVAFAFFDPNPPPSYRTVRTRAIPIEVRPGRAAQPGPAQRPAAPREPGPSRALVALAVLGACAAGFGLWRVFRKSRQRRSSP